MAKPASLYPSRRTFLAACTAGTAIGFAGQPASLAAAKSNGELRVGAAEVEASPNAEGTFLIGPMKPSTGIHDHLYARALVLRDGRTTAAILTLDYLGFDFAYTNRLIKAISDAIDVPASHIMLNCSHTHSAPLTAPWGPWKKHRDAAFFDDLPKKVAEVSRAAMKAMQPARVKYSRESVQIGFNRRKMHKGRITMAPNPEGKVLPWVDVLHFENTKQKTIAVLFSYAAHPVIIHSASTLISNDYPGFATQQVRRKHGDAVVLFAQGCCGNINGFPLKGGIDAAQAAGRDLGDAVIRAVESDGAGLKDATLKLVASDPNLPFAAPPPTDTLQKLHDAERKPERRQRFAELIAIAKQTQSPKMRLPMRALSIGKEFCLLGMAHEPFAEYHHYVLNRSPFKMNMVLGYTNGLETYLGTAKDYALGERGGYETSPRGAAFMFKDRLPLAAEAEGIVHKEIETLLKKTHQS